MKNYMSSRGRLLAALGLVAIALLLTGCAGKFTGGGRLPSADLPSGQTASFGFTYAITRADGSGKLSGSYHDAPVGVKFSFDGLDVGVGSCEDAFGASTCAAFDALPGFPSTDDCLLAMSGSYRSTSKASPGNGKLRMAACDGGEPGPSSGDMIIVALDTGPYAGYQNGGPITNGNLQSH